MKFKIHDKVKINKKLSEIDKNTKGFIVARNEYFDPYFNLIIKQYEVKLENNKMELLAEEHLSKVS